MDISALLASTLSPHLNERDAAIAELDNFAAQNYLGYTVSLVQELANEMSDPNIRKAAGLAVKNRLTAREQVRKEEFRQKWTSLPVEAKNSVKQAILMTLGSPVLAAGKTAAQIVAAFVEIEIFGDEWPDVIDFLVKNIAEAPLNMRYSSLLTIGYICETTDPGVFQSKSDQIISAVVQGARQEEPIEVRHVAIKTLFNCLELARPYFEDKDQRDGIMQVVCEATQSSDVSVQAAAFECLCRIMQLYYNKMHYYMENALYEITAAGMKHFNEQVALQAVEFWSTVCDEEISIQQDADEDPAYKRKGKRGCLYFARSCLQYVLPAIFSLLMKQEEDEDDDEWNVSMAAGTCLSLLAQCVGNDIIEPIVAFVEENIQNPDWHRREAAVLAFGSIVDGPDVDMLASLVEQALPFLIEMMTDPDVQVKDSTAWALGRISDLLVRVVQSTGFLGELVDALIAGISESPRVTANCCWAMTNLITHLAPEDLDVKSHQLSAYFEKAVAALLTITNRTDNPKNCRTSAYEAIANIVSQCNRRNHPMLFQLCNVIIDRFNQAIIVEQSLQSIEDRMSHAELLSNLCGVLTSLERQLGKKILPYAGQIANILVQLLNTAERHPTVVEDVLLVAGALTTAIEEEFEPFADHFVPFLYPTLKNHQEYQVYQVAVAVVGDVCRALGVGALKYCDGFVTVLLENLSSSELDQTVKPALLSCFGDIALAIGGSFEKYLDVTMKFLEEAATVHRTAVKSVESRKLIKKIHSALLEAYIGIVQGLRHGGKSQLLLPYTKGMMSFLYSVYISRDKTDTMLRNTIGLLGDLGETFIKGDIKLMLGDSWVRACVREGRESEETSFATKETSRWAKEILRIASKP